MKSLRDEVRLRRVKLPPKKCFFGGVGSFLASKSRPAYSLLPCNYLVSVRPRALAILVEALNDLYKGIVALCLSKVVVGVDVVKERKLEYQTNCLNYVVTLKLYSTPGKGKGLIHL